MVLREPNVLYRQLFLCYPALVNFAYVFVYTPMLLNTATICSWKENNVHHRLVELVVDSSASQSARTSCLWNEEWNQCATKVFLLSVSSESEKYWRIWLKPRLVIFPSIGYTQCLRYLKCICFFLNIPLVPLTGPWRNREKENIVIMINARWERN